MRTNKSTQAMKRNATKAEALLKLMANAKRLMILCHLSREEMTVNELVKLVGLSQSALSQHLAKMRLDDLVAGEKRGQSVYYRIAKPEVEALLSTLYLIYCRS
jgi:DNA-binding transcriptional ArsR family regulator